MTKDNKETISSIEEIKDNIEVERIVEEAEYLGSPLAESMSDSDRLTKLIHIAQKLPTLIEETKKQERERIDKILDENIALCALTAKQTAVDDDRNYLVARNTLIDIQYKIKHNQ